MKRTYHTRQKEAVLAYLASLGDGHASATQIADHIAPVGRATVYRILESLTESGTVRKYAIDGVSGACYQYIGGGEGSHLHLKCEGCGELLHLHCDTVDNVRRHVLDEHAFQVNATVLYGKCEQCIRGKHGVTNSKIKP